MSVPASPLTRVERLGLVAGLLLMAALMWPLRGMLSDDTFFQLQYARHLAAGQGLVFNLGERVYGCATPLWVGLIADGMALGGDGLTVARVLAAIASLASVGIFLQLMRRTLELPALRALATVAWSANAWMLRWSTAGLETPLAVALVLAGFAAITEGKTWGARPIRTGALWGLACLVRPEAVFLLVLWLMLLIVDAQNRAGVRRLAFGLMPPALIYGSWLGFSRLYFGTFSPQVLSVTVPLAVRPAARLAHLARQAGIVGASDGVALVALGLALLFDGPRSWPRRENTQRWLPWVWVAALPALFASRGFPVVSRHLLLVIPVLEWLAWRASERWWLGPEPGPRRRAQAVMLGAALAILMIAQSLTLYATAAVPQAIAESRALEGSLVKWGRWFGRHAPPASSIASPEVGAIGFFSGHPVLDLSGGITPAMAPLLEREGLEQAVAGLRFESVGRPMFVVERNGAPYDLARRSPYRECITPLGAAGPYSFYRIDWSIFDRLSSPR